MKVVGTYLLVSLQDLLVADIKQVSAGSLEE